MCCRSKHDYSSRAQSIYSPNVEGELYMWFLRQSQSRRPRNTCYLQVSVIKFRASGGRRALSPLTTLSSREDWRGKKGQVRPKQTSHRTPGRRHCYRSDKDIVEDSVPGARHNRHKRHKSAGRCEPTRRQVDDARHLETQRAVAPRPAAYPAQIRQLPCSGHVIVPYRWQTRATRLRLRELATCIRLAARLVIGGNAMRGRANEKTRA